MWIEYDKITFTLEENELPITTEKEVSITGDKQGKNLSSYSIFNSIAIEQ